MNTGTVIALKLAAAASVAFTGSALAHPHENGENGEKVTKVIVMPTRDGKDADRPVRQFHMMRDAKGKPTCLKGQETRIDETTGGDRTKILICGDDKLSNAERAKKLEETLGNLREGGLSGEHKAKVEAALEEAIARLRASN